MSWPITRSNSHIRDSIAIRDIIPDDVAVVWDPVTEKVRLPDDPAWRSSNLIPFGMGESDDGYSLVFHNSLTIFGTRIRMSVNKSPWRETYVPGTFSFRPEGFNGLPTAYREYEDNYIYIAYDEVQRRWYHGIRSTKGYVLDLSVVAVPRGPPFWLGKAEGPYIVHGIYEDSDDLDLWGGWVDPCYMQATLTTSRGSRVFYGDLLMDREYHRAHWGSGSARKPASFSAMSLSLPQVLDMMILQAVNPIDGSTEYKGVPFQHQGRLNFIGANQDFTFDDFVYEDDGGIPPDNYKITGDFEGGTVDLEGKVFKTYGWDNVTRPWYNPDSGLYWGRTFVRWNGEISSLEGPVLQVNNALGFAEFTKLGRKGIGLLPLGLGLAAVGGVVYAARKKR